MTKKELVAKLKELGLKGNTQESKKVLEARLEEATVKTVEVVDRMKEMENLSESLVKATKLIMISTPKRTYIGRHPITGEELYK